MRAGAELVHTELIVNRDRPRGTRRAAAEIDVHQYRYSVAAVPVPGLPAMSAADVRITATLRALCGSSRAPAQRPAAGVPPARSAAVAEHVVAVMGVADALSLELADAIVQHGAATPKPSAWLARIFASYPGCAVAAGGGRADEHVVGLRDGAAVRFTPLLDAHGPEGGDRDIAGVTATTAGAVYASLIYAWVADGQRLACLDRATIKISGGGRAGSVRLICRVDRAL